MWNSIQLQCMVLPRDWYNTLFHPRYKSDVDGLMKTCFTAGRPPPTCLRDYMTYVHSLGYKETPDYTRAKQMFVKELSTHRLKDNGKNLDWMSSGSKVSNCIIYMYIGVHVCTVDNIKVLCMALHPNQHKYTVPQNACIITFSVRLV